jgi:2-polyprenyl-3-methyl-5-hydroxy-6-metoxy-1,4-benzoquinol methylase
MNKQPPENFQCRVCGGKDFAFLYRVHDLWNNNNQITASYYQCKSCNLIFQFPMNIPEDFKVLYPESYEVYQPKKAGRLEVFGLEKRAKIILKQKNGGKLLDIGCATGEFIKYMRDYKGWNVTGVEPDQKVALHASTTYKLEIINSSVENFEIEKKFDVITLWDVLEHVEEPEECLEKIFDALNQDGVLVLRLPNSASLDAKIFQKYWAGIDSPRHFYIFNPENLSIILKNKGFKIIDIRTDIGIYLNFVKSIQFYFSDKFNRTWFSESVINILRSFPIRLLLYPFFSGISLLKKGNSMVITAIKYT